MPGTKHRVLLVDDHAVVRAGHRALLQTLDGFDVIAEASDGEQALRVAAQTPLDVAIVDLELPGISGLETCTRLIRQHPDLRVLVITVHESPVLQAHAERAGARGFLSKSAPAEHFIEALMTVAAGTPQFTRPTSNRDTRDALASLTPREFEILRLLATGASISTVADTLHLSPKTVSNGLTSLRAKLDVKDRQGLVRFALSCGLGDN